MKRFPSHHTFIGPKDLTEEPSIGIGDRGPPASSATAGFATFVVVSPDQAFVVVGFVAIRWWKKVRCHRRRIAGALPVACSIYPWPGADEAKVRAAV